MNELSSVFMVLLLVVAIVGSLAWHHARSRQVLEEWARREGYELVQSEYRMLFRGPFFLTSSKGQTVYYVRVRDQNGRERSGYVRCGSWFFGLWTNDVEARWEAETW
jgi:hypothetical protein